MSRETQFVGLPEKAKKFLVENAIKNEDCIWCGMKGGYNREAYDNVKGMFGEDISIFSYKLKNGTEVKEVEQCSPWSSGPVIFTKLVLENGKEIKWTEKEIEKYL
ncbi:hypothetical protein M0R19_05510 [Candidatus Pacearchaeota archaeon]|jgi:hypothetical protein|nr:hypothetical protein [Candidatus Pacearchaeota archaeon]